MRRLLSLIARHYTHFYRVITIGTLLSSHHYITTCNSPVTCSSFNNLFGQAISVIDSRIIKIECNGDLIGYAYCFMDGFLVTSSLEQVDARQTRNSYQFYAGDHKLLGTFKIVGHFQNLSFVEYTLSDKIKPVPSDVSEQPNIISEVQIMLKRQFISIKNGYLVGRDSGYGIVDGKGEVGSLVIRDGKAVGIVSHVGRQSQADFLQVIEWKNLTNILKYITGKNIHLGISAKAMQEQQGISVIRVAPNSPLKDYLLMGDIVLRANGQKVRQPQALHRICVMDAGILNLSIIRDGVVVQIAARV